MLKSSWKTSLAAVLGTVAVAMQQVNSPEWVPVAGSALLAIAIFFGFKNARDADVSSEDMGIK